jgi:hypothetical protein
MVFHMRLKDVIIQLQALEKKHPDAMLFITDLERQCSYEVKEIGPGWAEDNNSTPEAPVEIFLGDCVIC